MNSTANQLPLLRIVTCGSVDDGKSTLIGRLLYESKGIFEDQLASIESASKRFGTQGDKIDLALLTDGLKAEREQGITIDVAYRYFSTPASDFILADCPGHEQYTRNMATGASTADVALLLIDARHGVVTQTRRHAAIVAMLGIREVVAVVNKMDLLGFDRARFEAIAADFKALAHTLGIERFRLIPASALDGDNITARSPRTPWFDGLPLLELIESIDVTPDRSEHTGFRLPVQIVSRPDHTFRGYMGTVTGGEVRVGDEVVALPAGATARVKAIFDANGEVTSAPAGRAITLTLDREIDASRGDVLATRANPPVVAERFVARLVCFAVEGVRPGTSLRIKSGTRLTGAHVTAIRHRLNVNTLETSPAAALELNDIAEVEIECARPIVFDAYERNRSTGAFILIDPTNGNTAAAGMILSAIDTVVDASSRAVSRTERAVRLKQQPGVIRLVGPAELCEDVATRLERLIFDRGRFAVTLDPAPDAELRPAIAAMLRAGLLVILTQGANAAGPNDTLRVTVERNQPADAQARQIVAQLAARGQFDPPATEFTI